MPRPPQPPRVTPATNTAIIQHQHHDSHHALHHYLPHAMISPQKSPLKNNGNGSPRTAAPLRGLFVDGSWRCNCPGRPPAAKLQTKNNGVNHGRWFYTCQQPQNKGCDFFLWATDAEARAKLVILANSHSEHDSQTRTPSKASRYQNGLPTPMTDRRPSDPAARKFQTQIPWKSAKERMIAEDSADTESFDWDGDLDDEMGSFSDPPPRQPDFGEQDLPRKAPRTPTRTSPGKRKLADFEDDGATRRDSGAITPQASQSQTELVSPLSAEVSMSPTPSRYTNTLSADSLSNLSEFAGQGLKLLEDHGVVISRRAQNDLASFLNTHDLKTKGIIRGRDISRIALKKKDEQIMRLNERIQSLESQRELDRAMVNGLKRSC